MTIHTARLNISHDKNDNEDDTLKKLFDLIPFGDPTTSCTYDIHGVCHKSRPIDLAQMQAMLDDLSKDTAKLAALLDRVKQFVEAHDKKPSADSTGSVTGKDAPAPAMQLPQSKPNEP
jgi:hypothetical protein